MQECADTESVLLCVAGVGIQRTSRGRCWLVCRTDTCSCLSTSTRSRTPFCTSSSCSCPHKSVVQSSPVLSHLGANRKSSPSHVNSNFLALILASVFRSKMELLVSWRFRRKTPTKTEKNFVQVISALWDFRNFLMSPKGPVFIFFLFCKRMDVQKLPKGPFYISRHYATYRRLQNKFRKKIGTFFSSCGCWREYLTLWSLFTIFEP